VDIVNLSAYNTLSLDTNLKKMSFKQFERSFTGGLALNFANCLSSTQDFTVKTFSNLYLSPQVLISDIFDIESTPIKAKSIFGPIVIGGEYLGFFDIDSAPYAISDQYYSHYNYGADKFVPEEGDNTNFTIDILPDNKCQIFYTKNYNKFYLCSDIDNDLSFVKSTLLSFATTSINPQDFNYVYSESDLSLLLFKDTLNGSFAVVKSGEYLSLAPIIENGLNTHAIKLKKALYTYPDANLNMSYVTYDGSNHIDEEYSEIDQVNNLLLHRNGSITNVIVLKNQLLRNDTFASANNLLSGDDYNIYSNNLRDYTNIFKDVSEEVSDELELNYVFYNESYLIKPGSTEFKSPSVMSPFTSLNINDSKFIECGSFANDTPIYADRVYHLSNDTKNYDEGQYLLTTWLSGSVNTRNKQWVDRYYYPDMITKEEALGSKAITARTYDDLVENLINNNLVLEDSLQSIPYFDKISDLCFIPSNRYRYERINMDELPGLSPTFEYCSSYQTIYPCNYFNDINKSGELTIGFNFAGDSSSWVVKSDRNAIDGGLTFTKSGEIISIEISLYNANKDFYDSSFNSLLKFNVSSDIKKLKDNFICVSLNTKTGRGHIFLNDLIIKSFAFDIYQFTNKQVLFGDFFIYEGSQKTNLFTTHPKFNHVYINDTFIDDNLIFTLPILNGNMKIDDLTISLPCGMRNSSDNINLLNSACGSSSYKTNSINLHIKNLNISDGSVVEGIKTHINDNITLPVNTTINTIQTDNYK